MSRSKPAVVVAQDIPEAWIIVDALLERRRLGGIQPYSFLDSRYLVPRQVVLSMEPDDVPYVLALCPWLTLEDAR